jgi:glyoxylase I family protein
LKSKGVKILGEPTKSKNASEGQTWVYFLTPWGMQLELVSYPNGKAYEKDSKIHLWHPAKPNE